MAEHSHGDAIVRVDAIGTLLFTATSILAAVVFDGAVLWVGAITAITLFGVGIVTFLWAFYNAVQRSRVEEVSVTQLFLLLAGVAPARVRNRMLGLLVAQIAVGLATALSRPDSSDGSPGSSLALGVLVPMFGLGLNGLWAAFHGTFRPRADADAPPTRAAGDGEGGGTPRPGVVPTDAPIDQNGDHA